MSSKSTNIVYTNDDIFSSVPYSVIVHAGNCGGSWGAGIAKQIAIRYPEHYSEYKKFCESMSAEDALGGSLFINKSVKTKVNSKHYIACLFTNIDYGTRYPTKQQIDSIIDATSKSLKCLLSQIQEGRNNGMNIGEIHMPKINSGYFGVPWELTENCIRDTIESTNYLVYIHSL